MTEHVYGTITFPDKIDITDPCYNRDTWCRINNFPIPAGTYECYTLEANNEETHGWGERVARIGIRTDKADKYEYRTSIGVDAGLAGFFNYKPDYSDSEWAEFCAFIEGKNAVLTKDSFFSSSGYGDGSYGVYVGFKKGNLVEVYIDFIENEELYDDDDEFFQEEEYTLNEE